MPDGGASGSTSRHAHQAAANDEDATLVDIQMDMPVQTELDTTTLAARARIDHP